LVNRLARTDGGRIVMKADAARRTMARAGGGLAPG